MTWTSQNSGVFDWLFDVTYGDGIFVAVGTYATALISRDGVNWTKQVTPAPEMLFGVTYGGGRFVAVGMGGGIVTSP